MRRRLAWIVRFGILPVALALVGCGQSSAGSLPRSAPSGTRSFTLRSGGHVRSFIVAAPAHAGTRAHPLVLVFHGAGDTAAHTVQETDFRALAKNGRAIVVYLQGYADTWNEGAGHTPAHQAGINDAAFTRAVIGFITARYRVDRRRIAAVGFSNGALLTELLGCRLASKLTLIAPVEGELPVSVSRSCRPARPISVLEVHATGDQGIPYGGGHFDGIGGGTTVLSAPASAARWAALDRCRSSTSRRRGGSTFTTHAGCADGVKVTLDTIHGGTHEWAPGIAGLVDSALVGSR